MRMILCFEQLHHGLVMELTFTETLQKALEAHKIGNFQEADRLYTAVLQAQPKHPDANHNKGVLAISVGKIQESLPLFKSALESNASIGQYWLSYIDALIQLDQIAEAQTVLDQAKGKGARGEAFEQLEQRINELNNMQVATDPDINNQNKVKSNVLDRLNLDQAIRLAKKQAKEGSPADSLRIYNDILERFPKNKRALDGIKSLSHGFIGKGSKAKEPSQDQQQRLINLYQEGKLQQALDITQQLLSQFPSSLTLYNIQAAASEALGQFDASIDSYKQALKIKPDYADAYYNMGNVLRNKGDLETAIDSYQQAVKIKPDYADAFNNMGVALNDKGDLLAAIDSYEQAVKIKPDYTDAFYNMGITLNNKGDLDAAINSYKQAIKIKPNFARAHYTMGNILKDKGDLDAAIVSYQDALKIKPDYAEASYNMGNALKDKGNLEAAIDSYQQALKIQPDYAYAYNNMGTALQDKGDLEAAIDSYKRALKIKPDYADAYNNLGAALQGIVFNKPTPDLMEIIISLLDRSTVCNPREIARAVISLLKVEPNLKELLEKNSSGTLRQPLEETIATLSELPLLLKLMSVCPITDLELESFLVNLRSALLYSVDRTPISPIILRFQSALAIQCFTNEFIYNQTDKETELLEELKNTTEKILLNGQQPSPQSILCLASYKALNSYQCFESLTVNTDIAEVFIRQVIEPKEESRLKDNIPILQEITDNISSKVREQYEANPYPRWVNLGLSLSPKTTPQLVKELNLRIFDNAANIRLTPNILIAGCGTGQHPIGTASRFKDSRVLAIDLSLSSLAYAKRKTGEMNLQNIDYMQADILDLGKLDNRFDIIESVGVLHHMDDPMAGWRILAGCLESGGLMRIGLYSELARQNIVKMREEIDQSGIGLSDSAMKLFRSNVINVNEKQHKSMQLFNDFYSLSELRDLLFHVQEHRFTIPQIQHYLTELGLKFCGFEVGAITSDFKRTNPSDDDAYDLTKWHAYEQTHPHAFAGMYQFWCQKCD